MTRRKRKASGFDQEHEFWPKALDLWRRGYSNAQVSKSAQAEGYDVNEDQVRYARNRSWTADELPARGAKWLREAVRQATDAYPNALEQQQDLFDDNFEVFQALKERLLARLRGGVPTTVMELAEPFPLSLPGVSKHLKVLQRAGLIEQGRHAQWRPCRLHPEPLRDVADWLGQYRRHWEASFDRLDDYLRELQEQEKTDDAGHD